VGINGTAWEGKGMGTAWARHGRGMGTAWALLLHVSAFSAYKEILV